jgi:hypothetical protein
MVLLMNLKIISKGDQYLKTQQYTILTKVVNELIRACFFKLHNKLSTF